MERKSSHARPAKSLRRIASTLILAFVVAYFGIPDYGAAQVVSTILNVPDATSNYSVFSSAINPVTNTAYFITSVELSTATELIAIDGVTNAVTTITSVPGNMAWTSIVINASTNTIYLLGTAGSHQGPILGVVGGATGAYSQITLPAATASANAIVVNSATNKIYVLGNDSANSYIWEVDGNAGAVDGGFTLPANETFYSVALNQKTNKLYAADEATGTLYSFDLQSGVVTTVSTLSRANSYPPYVNLGIAVDSVRNKIYVLNTNVPFNTVSIVDGATNTLLTARNAGKTSYSMDINTTTGDVYIANADNPGTVTSIDAAGNTSTITLGSYYSPVPPYAMDDFVDQVVVDSVQNKVYVGNGGSYSIQVIDGLTHLPAAIDIPFTGSKLGVGCCVTVAVNPAANLIYGIGPHQVAVLDGTGGKNPVASIFPKNVAFSTSLNIPSAPQTIYYANTGGAPMTVTNLEFNSVFSAALVQSNDCQNPLQPHTVCPISLTYTPYVASPAVQTGQFYGESAPAMVNYVNIAAFVGMGTTVLTPAAEVTLHQGAQAILSGTVSVSNPNGGNDLVVNQGSVSITLNAVTKTVPVTNGTFLVEFDTGSIPANAGTPYTVTYAYPGSGGFQPASATSSLTVYPD